jgi:hypothetical protein
VSKIKGRGNWVKTRALEKKRSRIQPKINLNSVLFSFDWPNMEIRVWERDGTREGQERRGEDKIEEERRGEERRR